MVPVRLFGAFRQFSPESSVEIRLAAGARVADLRTGFAELFAGNDNALALLKASAFATDQAVLDDNDPVPLEQPLSVLPPVCGG